MIAYLSGTVLHVGLSRAVLDVAGMGYTVELTAAHAASLVKGHPASMHTAFLVREASFTIYGFATTDERTLFEQLLTVNGIGPRHAIAALSTLDIADLISAIAADDDRPFRKVPGIGPKTARLIVMSLQDKVGAPPTSTATSTSSSKGAQPAAAALAAGPPERTRPDARSGPAGQRDAPARAEAIAGLTSLGWTKKTAQGVIESLFTADPRGAQEMSTAALIRAALARLAR